MNYIKTKDKIIKVKTNKWHELVDKQGKYISELEIIAQADTIEELCDEFVIDDKRNNVHYIMDYDDVIEERFYSKDIIYGAIWTDKGLIYVAKMNSEGVLELI